MPGSGARRRHAARYPRRLVINESRLCEVCSKRREGFNKYCREHAHKNRIFGSPHGRQVWRKDYATELQESQKFITSNREHVGVQDALKRLSRLVDTIPVPRLGKLQGRLLARNVMPEAMLIEALAVHHYAMFRGGWMANQPALGRLIARHLAALGGAVSLIGPAGARAFGEWINDNILRLLFNAWHWRERKREEHERSVRAQLTPFPTQTLKEG